MKTRSFFFFAISIIIGLSSCKQEYCTVKGTVKGVKDGAELVLQDEWNKFKVVSTTTVQDGAFEFHPGFSVPTHVYLYARNPEDVYPNPYDGGQLKDFFLEPGTVIVDVCADDEDDMTKGATGTVLNDAFHRIMASSLSRKSF